MAADRTTDRSFAKAEWSRRHHDPNRKGRAMRETLADVDWAMLRDQKLWLAYQDSDEAQGLLNLLDMLQDMAVDVYGFDEFEVFGASAESEDAAWLAVGHVDRQGYFDEAMTMPAPCGEKDCKRPARAAFRITRPTRADVRVTVYTDDRSAPKTASRACKECMLKLAGQLLTVLIDGDNEEGAT